MTKKPVVYNEAAIEVFEGLDGVRKRPNMYIGETDAHGLQQILKEAYDNGTDELQSIHFGKIKGYGNTIRVKIDEKTNTAYVHDEGRGIPVGKNEKTKISTLTTVLTRLHAGAKMQSADKSAYGAGSAGVNGVGIACTNALCDKFIVYTCRDNTWYNQEFKKGKEVTNVVKAKPDSVFGKLKCGTYLEFHPDKQIFGDAQFPVDAIREWLKTSAYLHPYVKTEFYYKNKVKEYHQPDGAVAFVKEKLEKLKLSPIGKPFLINNNAVTVSLQWSDSSSSDLLYSYVNGSPTTGGVHVNTLIKLIEDGIKPFAPKRAKYKAADLVTGLVGMINIRLTEPKFSSQTKERLVSSEAKDIITTNVRQSLQAFFASNKPLIKEIVQRAVEFNKLNESFKISKEAAAKIQTTRAGRTILPEKLTVSNTKIAEERELFLTEGDSAGNIAKFARDPYFQEILKMRGKVLNVIRAQNDKIFNNNEVISILQSIGYDAKAMESGNLDLSKLRVGKVIFFSDADADGCLAHDTKILTLDGKNKTIKALARQWKQNKKPIDILARDKRGNLVVTQAIAPRVTCIRDEYAEIKFTDGTVLHTTVDHKLGKNTRKGIKLKEVQYLRKGNSINSLYLDYKTAEGRSTGDYLAIREKNAIYGKYNIPLHRFVFAQTNPKEFKQWCIKNPGSGLGGALHIHHKNDVKHDNRPANLKMFSKEKHRRHHGKKLILAYNGSAKHKADLKRFFDSEEGQKAKIKAAKQITDYNKSDKHKETVAKLNADPNIIKLQRQGKINKYYSTLLAHGKRINQKNWDKYLAISIPRWENITDYNFVKVETDDKLVISTKKTYPQQGLSKFIAVCKKIQAKGIAINANSYNKQRAKELARGTPKWETYYRVSKNLDKFVSNYNHTVKSVKIIKSKPRKYYCLTVPKYGNFFIADKNGHGINSGNSHIDVLLCGLLYKLMPGLFAAGKVYKVDAPLFTTQIGLKRYYAATKDKLLAKLPPSAKPNITRLKGLGEANADLLREIAFNPETRKLRRILPVKGKRLQKFLSILGAESDYRKELLGVTK